MNFGTSKPIQNNSSTSEMEHSIDSSVINNAQEQQILQNINRLDGYFTENRGQVGNDSVQYYIQGKGVWFLDDGVVFEIQEEIKDGRWDLGVGNRESGELFLPDYQRFEHKEPRERVVLKLNFEGYKKVTPIGRGLLTHKSNFFYGNDSSKWCTDVPNYQEIIYENLYENIDLRYYSSEKGLKYDFIVHPGGEPNDIRMKYKGAQELYIDTSGNLEIKTQLRNIVDSDLFIYQDLNNNKKVIYGKFKLFTPRTYGFEITGGYDKNKAIIIDPLVYSTYIGGNGDECYWDYGIDIAVDTGGNAYVTGDTDSSNFPVTPGANDTTHNGWSDGFVLKLNPTGTTLIYSTYIGGSGYDGGIGIAVDTGGNAYVTGRTYSMNFPVTPGANDTTHNGGSDGFVLKLNPTGAALSYATYIGGSFNEYYHSIAVDTGGNAYVTGRTRSDFPTTPGANDTTHNGGWDVFVFKLNPSGAALSYSTYVGGSGEDGGRDITVDTAGNAYVTGYTQSSNFSITPDSYNTTHNGGFDGFVLKLNPIGSTLLYSTFVGGSGDDGGNGITVDTAGNAYVTGNTRSTNFPTTPGANETSFNGGDYDGFVLKLNPTGAALIYSTYIGGPDKEWGKNIAVDTAVNAYVTGFTYSSNFPVTPDAYDTTYNGSGDGFMLMLNTTGAVLLYSTYIGGSSHDMGQDIAVDASGNAYVSGYTSSVDFPITPGANDTTHNGGYDAFVLKLGSPFSPLFLSTPKVTPVSGNTSTEFNFTVKYFHLNDSASTGVKVYIDSTEHSMLEVSSADTNYIDGKDYFFKIKNLDVGNHTYSFWASNGTGTTSTLEMKLPKVINTPPKIVTQDNLTAIEDTYYEVSYEFEDIDVDNVGQPCSWDFITNASWLKFISNPPTLYGTPTNDDVGKYWVNIIIDDTNDTDETNFTLSVVDVNDKPIITTTNVEQIFEDEFYEVDYSATDIDSPIENQIWSLETNASSWLNFDTTLGVLNGTPTNDDVGDFWVNVSVNDNEGGADSTNFTLTVINVNDPPSITTDDLTFVRLGDSYEVDYEVIDTDSPGSKLIWSLETNTTWLSLNSSTGVLSGTPKYNDIGWYNVNVSVDDGDGGYDWHEFELTVLNRIRNFPPLITTEDIEIAMVDEYYEVDYNATDDYTPSELLIWYLETNASWLSIDIFTSILSGTPTEDNMGWFWVNMLVTDGEGGWANHNFTLRVIRKPGIKNNAPELSNPKMSPEKGSTKTEFTFSVHYYDSDSDTPVFIRLVTDTDTYEMELESGDAVNGIYECVIRLPEGEHNYYFTASDGFNSVKTKRFTTPFIIKAKDTSTDDIGWAGVISVIIVIILLLILFFLIRRKRIKQKDETKKEPPPAATYMPTSPVITYAPQQPVQPPIVTTPTVMPSVIPMVNKQEPQIVGAGAEQQITEDKKEDLID